MLALMAEREQPFPTAGRLPAFGGGASKNDFFQSRSGEGHRGGASERDLSDAEGRNLFARFMFPRSCCMALINTFSHDSRARAFTL